MATGNSQTILIAEDEVSVRSLIARILESRDYLVLQARHGGEALTLGEGHPGPIDLLITDIKMPVMDGKNLAERLHSRRPGLKVLYISGFPDGKYPGESNGDGGDFLPKPFLPDVLLSRVSSLLGAGSASPDGVQSA